jgi:50S ribosomal subunit-associated GTPase HflX
VKAHFRRAVARYVLGQEDAAKEDFEEVRRLDASAGVEVAKELARLTARAHAASQKQKKEWGSFFAKA